MQPIAPTVIVGAPVAGEAAQVKGQLEHLLLTIDKSTFDIAELLFKVKIKGYYTGWGYSTFKEYTNTLKIKPRKAQYLTRIVSTMDAVGITRDVYEPLGIARLREIASLEPGTEWTNPLTGLKTPMDEFIKGFVNHRDENGEPMDEDKLKEHVRTLKGLVGENDIVFETVAMTRLARDNSWTPAIELAKAKIGTVGKDDQGMAVDPSNGAAAEMLAVHFLTDPQNDLDAYQGETVEEEPNGNDE
jgi:hypothetical protein